MGNYTQISQPGNLGVTNIALTALKTRPIFSSEAMRSVALAQRTAAQMVPLMPVVTVPDTRLLLRPMMESLEQTRQLAQMVYAHTEVARSLAESFRRLTLPTLQLNFWFTQRPWPEVDVESDILEIDAPSTAYMTVTADQYGRQTIDGKRTDRANAITSRHGQLLQWFEANRDELVSEYEMKNYLKVKDPKQVMRDLKKELRLLGYQLSYERIKRQGVIYRGVIRRQQ